MNRIKVLFYILSIAAAWIPQAAVSDPGKRVHSFVSDDGVTCVTFDYKAGLMVTSAHCATGKTMWLSDGRTASVHKRRNFDEALGDYEATDRDIALLTPSESRRPFRVDRSPTLPVGTILYLQPPTQPAIPCPLLERRGLTLILDCYASEGLSGSPIFRIGSFGSRRVVGILSAIEPDKRLSWATHISSADWLTK